MTTQDPIQDLGQQMADVLMSAYGKGGAAGHLVFLPGGVAVPDDIVQSGIVNPAQMQTWLAINFDSPFLISRLDGSVLQRDLSHGSVSQIYGIAVTSARPVAAPGEPEFRRVAAEIASAQSAFGPPNAPRMIVCEPDDWIIPGKSAYWTSFDSTQTDTVSTNQPAEFPRVTGQFWAVRSLNAPQSSATDPIKAASGGLGGLLGNALNLLHPPPSLAPFALNAAARPDLRSLVVSRNWSQAAVSGALPVNTTSDQIFQNATPVEQVTANASTSIVVHLEHQCVTLGYFLSGQPWWNGAFLADKGWEIDGMPRGGLLPSPMLSFLGQTYALPIGLIVVRNLRISSQFSDQAVEVLNSPGGTVGPLSLFGAQGQREADGVTITFAHEGMQVVGLLCTNLPVLPPGPGPSSSSSSTSSSANSSDAGASATSSQAPASTSSAGSSQTASSAAVAASSATASASSSTSSTAEPASSSSSASTTAEPASSSSATPSASASDPVQAPSSSSAPSTAPAASSSSGSSD